MCQVLDHMNNLHIPTVHQQPTRRVGSIEDYDPVNEQYGSISQHNANPAGGGYRQETTYQVILCCLKYFRVDFISYLKLYVWWGDICCSNLVRIIDANHVISFSEEGEIG